MTDQDPTQAYPPPAAPPPPSPASQPPAAPDPGTPPPSPFAPGPGEPVSVTPAVPTSPVTPPAGARPGRSRARWLVAAVVVLAVAGLAAGATLLLTGSSAEPEVLAWAPADTMLYGEARLDLPGNQGTELAKVMSAFPGFDDQAAFPVKLGELFDQLLGKATDGEVSYTADIQPWFDGQLAVAIGELPSPTDPSSMRVALLVGVKDADKAAAWMGRMLTESGATSSTETHGGVTINVIDPGEMTDLEGGYAIAGPVLVAGDLASVKAVIDTGGKTGLASTEQLKEANASVTGDRLGYLYYDYAALMGALAEISADSGEMTLPQSLLDQFPDWAVATFRAEDSAFVMDMVIPHSELAGTAAEAKLPGLVPARTLLLASGQDVGGQLARVKDQYAQIDELADAIKQIDDALALVGGFDAVAGWMGEAGLVLAEVGDSVSGGIVVVPKDRAAADRLLTQLKGFLQLGGAEAGIAVSEESYAGATITVVDLSALAPLAGALTDGEVPVPTDLSIAWAVTDNAVVLGYGADFVKAVLDAPTAGSLAQEARFADALKRVGATNTGVFWVDIRAVRLLVEDLPFLSADEKSQYESDVKPYLESFDYLITATVPGTPNDTSSVVVRVSGE